MSENISYFTPQKKCYVRKQILNCRDDIEALPHSFAGDRTFKDFIKTSVAILVIMIWREIIFESLTGLSSSHTDVVWILSPI